MKYRDFTIKAIVNDPSAMEQKIINLHPKYLGKDDQKDTYFKVSKGKMKWRKGNIENFITHYERKEIKGVEETVVHSFLRNPSELEINALLETENKIAEISKQRKIFLLEDTVKIHLDFIQGNENFLEIEVIDRSNEKTNEALIQKCKSVQGLLEIADADLILTGYLDRM